ncbi:gfo/Idh/MocA family oxidoreductase [Glycomyces terrestris]|uniref:Gfo/Idh/MocA family oxidoreductase n=1 Tax=Glycomyces terrestris TaxID=2493553 RepID=A0A426V5M6_9ACTN|nr:gfo/Idh/MocA family oxidoreductase [Glycomyces terrestris]
MSVLKESPVSSPYRLAVVGTGGIAHLHADELRKHVPGRIELVAAVDPDTARLDAFKDKFGVARGYASIEELLASEELDLVDLCTPPVAHAPGAIAALEAGVGVVCEKPPALSLEEFDRVAAAAAASSADFAVISQHRFGSAAQRVRDMTASGVLGRLAVAKCDTLWFRPEEYFAVEWRGRWETEGGGPTMGHGIHQIDTLLSMVGPWSEVVATAHRHRRTTNTEDVSHAIVTLESGASVVITNSLLSPREVSQIRLDFDTATVELDHLYGYGDDNWTVHPIESAADDVLRAWAGEPRGQSSGHGAQFKLIADALDGGTAPPVPIEEARRTLELLAAIYASAFTGKRVRAGDIDPTSPFYQRMNGSGTPWPDLK